MSAPHPAAIWDAAGIRAAAERYIRPSSLEQLAACPGAAIMQAAHAALHGEAEDSPEASLGTDGHDRIAEAIEHWKLCQETGEHGADWGDCIALACNQATEDGVDGWTVWCMQHCLEFARDLITKHGIDPENVLTEQQLDMQFLGFQQKENSGRADLVLIVPFKLVIVIDWKLGFLDQGDADEHDQTQAYACAGANQYHCDTVLVYLVQPRAERDYRITGAKYDADSLRENRAWTQAVINLARGENPELCAGYMQCKYCDALATCPEARRYLMQARDALALLGEPDDAQEWMKLADAAKLAEKFAKDGKALVKKAMNDGQDVPGWKLGNPRAIKSCANVPLAIQKLQDAGRLLEACEAISIGISKLSPSCYELITDNITEKLSEPSLIQDKRSRA